MSRRSAAKFDAVAFERALVREFERGMADGKEHALEPLRLVVQLMKDTRSAEAAAAAAATTALRELHRLYQYVRSLDDNWRRDVRDGVTRGRPRRVHKISPATAPAALARHLGLVERFWPVLPFVSWLFERSKKMPRAVAVSRFYEYGMLCMCTHPSANGRMLPYLHVLAEDLAERKAGRSRRVDPAEVASGVVASFVRRQAAVGRYRAAAKTRAEAAQNVRRYVTSAMRKRMNDVLSNTLTRTAWERASADTDASAAAVPASTRRRWAKQGFKVNSPDEAAAVGAIMRERRQHSSEDRYSLASLAAGVKRARSTVSKALATAEREHGFKAERGSAKAFLLTAQQVRWVDEILKRDHPRTSRDKP